MMPFALRTSPHARKVLARLHSPIRERLDQALALLEQKPRGRGCKPLEGAQRPRWRRRVGAWRIVYLIHDAEGLVIVENVDRRDDVYRK